MVNKLLGTWISDPNDDLTQREYGDISMEFLENGELIYTVHEQDVSNKIFLEYQVVGEMLITDQRSAPQRNETRFIVEDKTLELYFDGIKSKYIKSQY